MKKRILAILTVILALCATAFFVACNNNNNKNDDPPKESYTLVINNDTAKGSVSVSPEQDKYENGSTVKITVSAKDGWLLDGIIVNGKIAEVKDGQTEIKIEKNTTVDVTYKSDNPEATYTLTINNDEFKGSVTVSPSANSYKGGTQVTVKVTAKGDNVAESITVNDKATIMLNADNSCSVTIVEDTVVIVNYKVSGGEDPEPPAPSDEKFKISINNDEEKGTFSVSPAQDEYEKNAKVTITVIAKDGYEVESVMVNGLPSAAKNGSATIVITSDTSIIIVYKEKTTGDKGTKENPYLISTAEELFEFSANINSPDSVADEKYSSAYFRLANDIDMEGVRYSAAGKKPETLADGTLDLSATFTGTFDGAGHTIKNLSILRNIRNDIYYVGLFGYTYMADIRDLTLENVCYEIVSSSDKVTVGASVGGVVGFAHLTNLTSVKVGGTIVTRVGSLNTMYIGGLAGVYNVSDDAQSYIAYIRNCNSAVKTEVGDHDDGDKSSLDAGINGGIVGYLNVSNGAAAIINSSSTGSVVGGKYLGGIVAYINGSNVSVINCLNYAAVRASTNGVAYAGGILGFAMGDVALMDCYSKGAVVSTKSGSATYNSYAGGIVGFAYEDDYDMSYDAGIAVINCYYSSAVRTYDVKNESGVKVEADAVNASWFKDTLRLDVSGWTLSDDGKYTPSAFDYGNGSYTLSFYKDGKIYNTESKAYTASGYSIIGVPNELSNENGKVFFDWAHGNGIRYRFYIPVVKDMILEAIFGDATNLAGVYTGVGDFHGETDGGVLSINADGTCAWIMSGNDAGTYKTDGKHIIFDFNAAGSLVGEIVGEQITLSVDYGMSGTVPYTFTKTDLVVFGEYYSETGDMITFTDKNVTFQSSNVNGGVSVSGTYSIDGNEITITCGSIMQKFYSSAKVTVNADFSLTLNFTGINGTESLNGVSFGKLGTPDYTGKAFLGTYYIAYLSVSGQIPIQSTYKLAFLADGTATYTSELGTVYKGNYYLFGDNVLKLNLENNISTFTFDSARGLIYGVFVRGMTANNYILLAPESEGAPKGFVVDADKNHYVLVNNKNVYYVHGSFEPTANISAENNFAEGDRVTINGEDYRAIYYRSTTYKGVEYISGYGLTHIGKEEGNYKNGSDTVVLDGIGNVTGTKNGTYVLYGTLTVVVFEDDTIIGFDYAEAKTAGNVITVKAPDKYQGVWTQDKTKSYEYQGVEYVENVKSYYKFILDGYGHVAYMYVYNYEESHLPNFKPVYKYNWGVETAWADYSENGTGLYCRFNSYNQGEMLFYYDMNLLYVKFLHDSRPADFEKYVKKGYTGTTEIPSLPDGATGSYNGSENGVAVVFNLKADLSGSYKGMPFNAVYDGNGNVIFKLNGETYIFNVNSKNLTYGDVTVALTRSGEVTEIIPAMFVGTWEGVWTEFGTSSNDKRQIKIEANGTLTYNNSTVFSVEYDNDLGKITGKAEVNGEPWEITLTYKSTTNSFGVKISYEYDQELRSLECSSLTKIA